MILDKVRFKERNCRKMYKNTSKKKSFKFVIATKNKKKTS